MSARKSDQSNFASEDRQLTSTFENLRRILARFQSGYFFRLNLQDDFIDHLLEEEGVATGQISVFVPEEHIFRIDGSSFMRNWNKPQYEPIKNQKLERGWEPLQFGHRAGYSLFVTVSNLLTYYDDLWSAILASSNRAGGSSGSQGNKGLARIDREKVERSDFSKPGLSFQEHLESDRLRGALPAEFERVDAIRNSLRNRDDVLFAEEYHVLEQTDLDERTIGAVALSQCCSSPHHVAHVEKNYYDWVLERLPMRLRIIPQGEIVIKAVLCELATLASASSGHFSLDRGIELFAHRLEEYLQESMDEGMSDDRRPSLDILREVVEPVGCHDLTKSVALDLWLSRTRERDAPSIASLVNLLRETLLEENADSVRDLIILAHKRLEQDTVECQRALAEYRTGYLPFEREVVFGLKTTDSVYSPIILGDELLGLFIGGLKRPIGSSAQITLDIVTKAIALPLLVKRVETEKRRLRQSVVYGEQQRMVTHTLGSRISHARSKARNILLGIGRFRHEPEVLEERLAAVIEDLDWAGEWIRRYKQLAGAYYREDMDEVDINSLVQDVIREVVSDPRIKMSVLLNDTIHPVWIVVEPVKTGVFAEILQNAVYFLRDSERPEITVRTQQVADQMHRVSVQVSISDNGSGILPEYQDRVFQPGFSTKPDGTGLGLAAARSYLEAHRYEEGRRASIEYHQSEEGTTFIVTIPVSQPKSRD